ncbi:MAG: hypothetical protein ACT4QF_13340 [Sporichthyaceae bacterium]
MTRSLRTYAQAILAVGLAIGSLSACGGESEKPAIAAIDVTPDQVDTVTFTAQGKNATLRAVDGLWTPVSGATVQAATMLTTASERYFPLNSYRIMEGLDQNNPDYGLNQVNVSAKECHPVCAMTVTNTAGKTWKLTIGKETFNGGFYAKVDGDPRVFLITKETVAGIISEALGKDFAFPASAKIRSIEFKLQGRTEDGRKTAELPDYDPYLRQVLAAEAVAACKKENRPGVDCEQALSSTASSTQDQPGAKEGGEVKSNSEALTQPGGIQ